MQQSHIPASFKAFRFLRWWNPVFIANLYSQVKSESTWWFLSGFDWTQAYLRFPYRHHHLLLPFTLDRNDVTKIGSDM